MLTRRSTVILLVSHRHDDRYGPKSKHALQQEQDVHTDLSEV